MKAFSKKHGKRKKLLPKLKFPGQLEFDFTPKVELIYENSVATYHDLKEVINKNGWRPTYSEQT